MRRLLPVLAVTLAACVTQPPRDYPEVKEIYVDAAAVTSAPALRPVPFPLPLEAEPGVYSALRSSRLGAIEGQQKLGRVLGQWPPPGSRPGDPALATAAPELDLSEYPAQDPPVILLATSSQMGQRDDTGCYLGHCAYAGQELDAGGREVIHHLRLLVVNMDPGPLRLSLDDVQVEAEGLASLERLAAADEGGARLDALEVAPGEQALAQLFFTSSQVPPSITVRWRLVPLRGDAPDAAFEVRLQRRYVLSPGRVSALEDAVARRLPLAAPRPRPGDPWREPRMEPVGR